MPATPRLPLDAPSPSLPLPRIFCNPQIRCNRMHKLVQRSNRHSLSRMPPHGSAQTAACCHRHCRGRQRVFYRSVSVDVPIDCLSRGRAARCSGAATLARLAVIIAHVRATAEPSVRAISPHCPPPIIRASVTAMRPAARDFLYLRSHFQVAALYEVLGLQHYVVVQQDLEGPSWVRMALSRILSVWQGFIHPERLRPRGVLSALAEAAEFWADLLPTKPGLRANCLIAGCDQASPYRSNPKPDN